MMNNMAHLYLVYNEVVNFCLMELWQDAITYHTIIDAIQCQGIAGMKQVFVGGTGRSGTTVVFHVLGSHPHITAGPDELRIHADPGGLLDVLDALSTDWSPKTADIALHRFYHLLMITAQTKLTDKLKRRIAIKLGFSPPSYVRVRNATEFGEAYYFARVEKLMKELSYATSDGFWFGTIPYLYKSFMYETHYRERAEVAAILAEFLNDLYKNIAKDHDTHWVESSPDCILFAHKLLELFPEAKFIHMIRDPRDIISSYYKQDWGGGDYSIIAKRIVDIYARWNTIRQQIPDTSYLELKLEAITANPVDEFEKIASFLQLDNPQKFDLSIIRPESANRDRWKNDIPSDELTNILEILQPTIEQLGYE